jgi:hypothetical protein
LPLSYAERPLTLPRLVLAPWVAAEGVRTGGTQANLTLGAAIGLTDDLQVSAIFAPLQLSPTVTYGEIARPGPSVGITYRVYRRDSEIALHVDGTVITRPLSSGAVVRPGLRFRNHLGALRIDSAIVFAVTAARTTTVGFAAPIALSVNAGPFFHLGADTGIALATFEAPINVNVPLGTFMGVSIGGSSGALLDIDGFFHWPAILTGAMHAGSTADAYEGGVVVRGYWAL